MNSRGVYRAGSGPGSKNGMVKTGVPEVSGILQVTPAQDVPLERTY